MYLCKLKEKIMETEKKFYVTPILVEHGTLINVTKENCAAGPGDILTGEDPGLSGSCG